MNTQLRALIAGLLLFAACLQAAASGLSRMIVFGDSLSDTGNRASTSFSYPWPYFDDRVSNGPLAVDQLASLLNLGANSSLHLVSGGAGWNYAVAGASAGENGSIDLTEQIDSYLDRTGNVVSGDHLVIVFIGGNDIRAATVAGSDAAANTMISLAVNSVEAALTRLISAGARSIMVVNAPNVGRIPEAAARAADEGDPQLPARATALTVSFNQQIGSRISTLAGLFGVYIAVADLYSLFENIVSNPLINGFTNTTDACFLPGEFSFHPDCALGSGFDEFVFFDQIHPTAKAHKIIGDFLFAALPVQNAPAAAADSPIGPALFLLLFD